MAEREHPSSSRGWALLSAADKTGLVPLAQELASLGFRLLSTGGTARTLSAAGLPVTEVSSWTGFPEILDGRVKTLHPRVHAGILARRDVPAHEEALRELGIEPIDVVVVNLYPFREVTATPVSEERALEEIDIGGVALLRAAAKNYPHVLPLVDPADYEPVLAALRAGEVPVQLRRELAVKVFRHTAAYDAAIARYLGGDREGDGFPREWAIGLVRAGDLRYGENPHQKAALYREDGPASGLLAAQVLHGKPLSYNNLLDAQAAVALAGEFQEGPPAAVAIKHQTPCGVALGATPAEAFRRARDADPVSIFGGVVALTRPVDEETARELRALFLEVVVAPAYSEEALAVLRQRRDLRVLALPTPWPTAPATEVRRIWGGYLVQEGDTRTDDPSTWRRMTSSEPTPEEAADALFAWKVVKHVRSNAIVVARDGMTLGIGGGQVNRIDAARQALARAGERARGAVLASDAFFPFGDVVAEAAKAGIRAIVEPGGSVRDQESVDGAEAAGMVLWFTGVRHFKH